MSDETTASPQRHILLDIFCVGLLFVVLVLVTNIALVPLAMTGVITAEIAVFGALGYFLWLVAVPIVGTFLTSLVLFRIALGRTLILVVPLAIGLVLFMLLI